MSLIYKLYSNFHKKDQFEQQDHNRKEPLNASKSQWNKLPFRLCVQRLSENLEYGGSLNHRKKSPAKMDLSSTWQ
jgi:hypothetical protein